MDFSVVNLRAIYLPLITKFTPPLLQSLLRKNNVYRLKYISIWNILTHNYISILFISDRLPRCLNINFCFVFTIIINDTKFTPALLQSLQRAMSIDWNPHSQRVNISILFPLHRLPQCFNINSCLLFFNHYMVSKWLLRRSIMCVQAENIHISSSSNALLSLKLIVMMNARLGFHRLIPIQSNCCVKGKILLSMQMFFQ